MSEKLRASQIQAIKMKNDEDRWFVPDEALYNLITAPVVRATLQESSIETYYYDHIVQRVTSGDQGTAAGQATFAILVEIDAVDKLFKLMTFDLYRTTLDAKLPRTCMPELNEIFESRRLAESFYYKQWEYVTPRFMRGSLHLRLDNQAILPFTTSKPISKDMFSSSSKTTMIVKEGKNSSV